MSDTKESARSVERDRIVDAALQLADEIGWERVTLGELAERLGITLGEIAVHFREKDDIGDAWLNRTDAAMLALSETPEFREMAVPDRLETAIMTWLDGLAPHKRTARDILLYRLRPAHVHLMAGLVVRLSQTVQWLREVSNLRAGGRRKQIEEIGLTTLFASTVLRWLADRSQDHWRTRAFLRRGLARSDRIMSRLPMRRR